MGGYSTKEEENTKNERKSYLRNAISILSVPVEGGNRIKQESLFCQIPKEILWVFIDLLVLISFKCFINKSLLLFLLSKEIV